MVRRCLCFLANLTESIIAWKINLNLSLVSFDDSIRGVRALVDFAITSPLARPPHFVFVSSISVFISACLLLRGQCPFVDYISRFREQWLGCGRNAAKSRDLSWHWLFGIEVGSRAYPRYGCRAHRPAACSRTFRTSMWGWERHLERDRVVPIFGKVRIDTGLSAKS